MTLDSECANKHLIVLLDNFEHLALGLNTFASGGHENLHLVAVEGVHRIALGNEYSLIVTVENHGVLAVAASGEYSGSHIAPVGSLVFTGSHLNQLTVKLHLGKAHGYSFLCLWGISPDSMRHLLVIECLVTLIVDKIINHRV